MLLRVDGFIFNGYANIRHGSARHSGTETQLLISNQPQVLRMKPLARRRFLRTLGASGVALSAGCSTATPAEEVTPTVEPALRTESGWSEFRGDRYNTGLAAEATDIEPEPTVKWTFDAGDDFWGSPIVGDGTVFSGCADTSLYALDTETGNEEWRFQADHRIESTPAYADGTVYVGSYDQHVYALDAETGELEWDLATAGLIRSSPKIVDGTVYIGVGCHNLACKWYVDEPRKNGWLFALDAETGEVLWRFSAGSEVVSTPAVGRHTLFVGSSDGYLYALDRVTGEEQWRYRTRDWIWSAPTLAFGTVYFGDWNSKIYALDAASGEEEWIYNSYGTYISASTAGDETAVYFGHTPANEPPNPERTNAEVFALDRTSGEELWTYTTDALEIGSSPVITDEYIYIGSHSQVDEEGTGVYALTKDGSEEWYFEVTERGVGPSPALVDRVLYFGGADGTLYAIE
jgi:outer membrane protein assembly factor BamB